jgi:hypothetical protein
MQDSRDWGHSIVALQGLARISLDIKLEIANLKSTILDIEEDSDMMGPGFAPDSGSLGFSRAGAT